MEIDRDNPEFAMSRAPLTERLRHSIYVDPAGTPGRWILDAKTVRPDMTVAAGEIERLRAVLEPFVKLAEHYKGHSDDGAVLVGLREVFAAQRALLEGLDL